MAGQLDKRRNQAVPHWNALGAQFGFFPYWHRSPQSRTVFKVAASVVGLKGKADGKDEATGRERVSL